MNSNAYSTNGTSEPDSFASGIVGKFDRAIDTIILAAQDFSHLAKIATGENRKQLYQAKSNLLSLAFTLDPASGLTADKLDLKKRLVGVERNDIRLHIPVHFLSLAARHALLKQIKKVLEIP